jgi:hypothetical protein
MALACLLKPIFKFKYDRLLLKGFNFDRSLSDWGKESTALKV